MNFSQQVKREIINKVWHNPCCITAACYGIACFGRHFDTRGVVFYTERAYIAQWAKAMYEQAGITGNVYVKGKENSRMYEFVVKDPFEVEKMLALFGHSGEETAIRIHPDNFACSGCFSAFSAAAFLCCGTIVDPQKGYLLEYVSGRHLLMDDFTALLKERSFEPKQTQRKGASVVYFKASGQIEDMLTAMGASKPALEIMNLKVYRDIRNTANRITNCESANIDKMLQATRQVLEDIALLEAKGVLSTLPAPIQEAAKLRKQNPELSLAELAEIAPNPVSKSGLSHRYRKLAEKAADYK